MTMKERMEKFAEVMGIKLRKHPDRILRELAYNEKRFGVPSCPCIFMRKPGQQETCPCRDAYQVAEGLREECTCGLFVKK